MATYLYRGHTASETKGKGKGRQKEEKLQESGKLQIWKKAPFDKNRTGVAPGETSSSAARGPVVLGGPQPSGDGLGRRGSAATTSSISFFSRRTFGSNVSKAPSSAQTTQITIGSSSIASESHMPEPPLLVLFLERKVGGGKPPLSFLVITIDKGTKIDPSACDCRFPDSNCSAVVIKKKGGFLSARRFPPTTPTTGTSPPPAPSGNPTIPSYLPCLVIPHI